MRVIKRVTIFALVLMSVAVVSVSAQDTKTLKTNQTIERKVFKRINSLPYYGVFDHIAFKVEGSTVTLSGKVAEIRNRKDAENAVRGIEGVSEVVNQIEVLPLSRFDDTIRRNALRTISRDGGSLYRYLLEPLPAMRIIVDRGHITLEGYVSGKGDSDLAYMLARTVPGVFSVTNNLKIGKAEY